MTLELDDEAIEMIDEYNHYAGDESYAAHLAAKISSLYVEQS